MPYTLFISDLHLSSDREDITACFDAFVHSDEARQAEALYILGDLFEYWVGDDDDTPFQRHIAALIKRLADTMPVYFIHGNRDFMIGQRYARQSGMTLLPEQQVIDLYGTPTLICHGDEWCTDDVEYQQYRARIRDGWLSKVLRCLPLFVRRWLGNRIRQKSLARQQHNPLDIMIMDVTPEAVATDLRRHQVTQTIHGHTHRPAVHRFELDGKPAVRVVLGDWYEQGSVLRVDNTGFALQSRPFVTN
ncbi:UDP-2,3-diacylglucosamine diphosphatase [Aestuariibacter halophilus]|uniref:UDP-2,3-diacylglucosamine hydrolase n=1 Tax=Fluctibacter halophilus TaxID=226011 RepID=A0ABS8G7S8_9ALTE|nr:UDP-2,3-diacylglucosamine diphosphatase [Aestuariibacter halophilus]MCC2616196.1 UDP-2,3-diacylglucosamine diphosphatase [Aestuariibacter halophilus]